MPKNPKFAADPFHGRPLFTAMEALARGDLQSLFKAASSMLALHKSPLGGGDKFLYLPALACASKLMRLGDFHGAYALIETAHRQARTQDERDSSIVLLDDFRSKAEEKGEDALAHKALLLSIKPLKIRVPDLEGRCAKILQEGSVALKEGKAQIALEAAKAVLKQSHSHADAITLLIDLTETTDRHQSVGASIQAVSLLVKYALHTRNQRLTEELAPYKTWLQNAAVSENMEGKPDSIVSYAPPPAAKTRIPAKKDATIQNILDGAKRRAAEQFYASMTSCFG